MPRWGVDLDLGLNKDFVVEVKHMGSGCIQETVKQSMKE